jgi:hypothetical protein
MGDDVPYVLESPGGELVELPIDTAADDWVQYAHSYDFDFLLPIRAPGHAVEVFQAEIDAAIDYGGMWIAVFHPFVSGRPSRLRAVRTLLEQLLERSGAWIPRRERVPYYTEPLAALELLSPVSAATPGG